MKKKIVAGEGAFGFWNCKQGVISAQKVAYEDEEWYTALTPVPGMVGAPKMVAWIVMLIIVITTSFKPGQKFPLAAGPLSPMPGWQIGTVGPLGSEAPSVHQVPSRWDKRLRGRGEDFGR